MYYIKSRCNIVQANYNNALISIFHNYFSHNGPDELHWYLLLKNMTSTNMTRCNDALILVFYNNGRHYKQGLLKNKYLLFITMGDKM